jgi:hypothetical protein
MRPGFVSFISFIFNLKYNRVNVPVEQHVRDIFHFVDTVDVVK